MAVLGSFKRSVAGSSDKDGRRRGGRAAPVGTNPFSQIPQIERYPGVPSLPRPFDVARAGSARSCIIASWGLRHAEEGQEGKEEQEVGTSAEVALLHG